MDEHYIVTGVLDHITLCVPKEIFGEHFTVDGWNAKHKWYFKDEYLQDEWDEFVKTYRMDSEESVISFGDIPSGVDISHIYQWSA